MGGCSAINCTNHSRNGCRMVRFPKNRERRRIWLINCRRGKWEPSHQAQLCIDHFDDSQFESLCNDRKKLRRNAVPTLFSIPNRPPSVTEERIKEIGCPKIIWLGSNHDKENPTACNDGQFRRIKDLEEENHSLKEQKKKLEEENRVLKELIKEKDEKLSSFLSDEQIAALPVNEHSSSNWSNQSVVNGLKLRFALGKRGYDYIRSTGYPAPSCSTMNRRIKTKLDILIKMPSLDLKANPD